MSFKYLILYSASSIVYARIVSANHCNCLSNDMQIAVEISVRADVNLKANILINS